MRNHPFKTLIILIFLFTLLLIPGTLYPKIKEKEKKSYDLQEWIEGPVRYISTYDEVQKYKSLKSDGERNQFIYKFWRRRDPSSLTMKNEFREQFWERVITTNQMFNESTKPGWKTDRGKIYIMAGPPNEIDPIPDPEPALGRSEIPTVSTSGHRGIERWIYEGYASLKASNYIVVAFYRDATGEYRLSYNPEHFGKVAPGIVPASGNYPDPVAITEGDSEDQQTSEEDTRVEQSEQRLDAQIARTEEIEKLNAISQFSYDLAEMVDTPVEEELLQERIRTFEFFDQMQKAIDFSLFQDANDQPYLNLSVQADLKNYYGKIPDRSAIPMSLFGNLKEISQDQNEFLFTSDPFAPNHLIRDNDVIRLSSSLSISPGNYSAIVGIQELLTGRITLFSGTINIPPFKDDRITLSDPILASKIEPAEESSQEGLSPIPGNLIVTPKVHSSFSKREEFSVYFQIYEVENDPATGKPSMDISYQFYRWDGQQFKEIGTPIVHQNIETQERGWSFPLEKWPDGKFKLVITVRDNVSGSSDSKELSFDITGP
jgi:GWxTD domain-containing protein